MINLFEVVETNEMITKENLDVRTITLGISLLDCIDSNLEKLNEKIYRKIYDAAKNLVKTGEDISAEFGIPIVYPCCAGRGGYPPPCRQFMPPLPGRYRLGAGPLCGRVGKRGL